MLISIFNCLKFVNNFGYICAANGIRPDNHIALIMKKLIIISILLNFLILSANAQYQTIDTPISDTLSTQISGIDSSLVADSLVRTGPFAHLDIIADTRIDTLIQIHKEENIRRDGIEGYRLQIFQGSKPEALEIKAKFISKYLGYKVYTPFISPDVYVRIGDFRSESEAVKLKYYIKKDFPNAIVIPSIIEYPELKN